MMYNKRIWKIQEDYHYLSLGIDSITFNFIRKIKKTDLCGTENYIRQLLNERIKELYGGNIYGTK